jgi:hypothetical protein
MEGSISALYTRLLGPPTKASEKRAQISGVGFGVSQGIMFLTCVLVNLWVACVAAPHMLLAVLT